MTKNLVFAIAALAIISVKAQAADLTYQADCTATVRGADGQQAESKFTLSFLADADTTMSQKVGALEFIAATKTTSNPKTAVFEIAIKTGADDSAMGVETNTALWDSADSGKLMPFVLSAVLHQGAVAQAKLSCVSESQN